MAGVVSKIPGSVATTNGGSGKRIFRESFYATLYAAWLLGTDYPSRLPTGAASPEIGDFAFKFRNLAPLGAPAPAAKYTAVSLDNSYSLPFSVADLVTASAGAGITLFGVADFGTATVNRSLISNYRTGIEAGTAAIARLSSGQYSAAVSYIGGTGNVSLLINSDAYSGTGPEFLAFTATTTSATLWRRKPGGTMQSATVALTNGAPGGTDNIRIGRHPVVSTAGEIKAYSGGAFIKALDATEMDYLYTDLQTLHGAYGVPI